MTGSSGTPGALPYLALAQRNYKGGLYGSPPLINPDFVRVGGAAVEGLIAPTGPVIVADQLPETNPTREVSMKFRAAYEKVPSGSSSQASSWRCFTSVANCRRPD